MITDKPACVDYAALQKALDALLDPNDEPISTLANAAALLYGRLPQVNWAGFYLLRGDALVLGPFQGRPACVRIEAGRGVCGAAAARNETLLVPDVHAFSGHIACDAASRSELVVPLRDADGAVRGVLDVDSPQEGRFDERDRAGLEAAARCIETAAFGADRHTELTIWD